MEVSCESYKVISMLTRGMANSGIEEDFSAWKTGFTRDVFPSLCGERPLTIISSVSGVSGGLCECGKQAKQECCKNEVAGVNGTPAEPEVTSDPYD